MRGIQLGYLAGVLRYTGCLKSLNSLTKNQIWMLEEAMSENVAHIAFLVCGPAFLVYPFYI